MSEQNQEQPKTCTDQECMVSIKRHLLQLTKIVGLNQDKPAVEIAIMSFMSGLCTGLENAKSLGKTPEELLACVYQVAADIGMEINPI